MKKLYSLFLSVLSILFFTAETKAQCLVELSGTAPISLNSKTLITGGGGGFGFYAPPIEFIPAQRVNYKKNTPIKIRR